jgi:hypothetical protein
MSFDKEYPNRKDRRKPYKGSKSFDSSCRPNGGCSWCYGNRTHSTTKRQQSADSTADCLHDKTSVCCDFCYDVYCTDCGEYL